MTIHEKSTLPTPEELERLSRFGRFNADKTMDAGIQIVSVAGKPLRVRVHYGSRRVWLQERPNGAAIQIETGRTKDERWSTRTTDWVEAVKKADNVLKHALMEDTREAEIESAVKAAAVSGEGATLAQLRDLYERERVHAKRRPVSDKHATNVRRVFNVLEIENGAGYRPGDMVPFKFVQWYVDLRTTKRTRFPKAWSLDPTGPVVAKTAISELKDFSGALELGVAHELLATNPLQRFKYAPFLPAGDDGATEHREEASVSRYRALMEPPVHPVTGEPLIDPTTDLPHKAPVHECFASDSGYRLRFFLASLFLTGRRTGDFLGTSAGGRPYFPTISDLLFTGDEIRAALRAAPNHRMWWAEHFLEHGAYRANRNKMRFHRIIPFGATWARERDLWLQHHPAPNDPRAALIPSFKDPRRPLEPSRMRKHLVEAERIAREFTTRMGLDPEKVIPELKDSRGHGYRPLWRTIMDGLGYSFATSTVRGDEGPTLNEHALFFGGWKIGGDTQSKVYSRIRPQWLVGVANFVPAAELVAGSSASLRDELDAVLLGV